MTNKHKLISDLLKIELFNTYDESVISNKGSSLSIHIPYQHYADEVNKVFKQHEASCSHSLDILGYKTKTTPHPNIKNIIAVASGKGGVGKSTCTYFLAHALQHMGCSVGVLDADIYGPSQSLMFNLETKPIINDNNQFSPFDRNGISVMSIGVLSSTQKAIMWRGPMISQALLQLYSQTQWPNLDFLLIDMPPGTGDIPLTLIQKIPVTASLMVSQPHPLAKLDVDKSINLFSHHGIPILGTIMNLQHNTHSTSNNTGLSLPFLPKFQEIKPIIHAEFIHISEQLIASLTKLPKYTENPFSNINITTESST